MKRVKTTTSVLIGLIFCFFVSPTFAGTALAADTKPEFSGSATATSKYVWRGYELSKDSLVFFLDGAVSYKGFAAEVWTDFDTDYYPTKDMDDKGNMELVETDLILSYSNSIDNFNYSFGWIYYDYYYDELAIGENQELYGSLGIDTLLSPTLSVYQEIEIGQATYVSLDLSHSVELKDDLSLDGGVKFGYMYDEDGDNGGSYSAMHDGLAWLGLSMPLDDYWTLSPTINYSLPLSDDAEDNIETASYNGDDSMFFWGSLTLSTSF